jgi:hypothetical protein
MYKIETIVLDEDTPIGASAMLGQVEEFARHARARGSRQISIMLLSDEGDPEEMSPEEQAIGVRMVLEGGRNLRRHYAEYPLICIIPDPAEMMHRRFEIRLIDASLKIYALLEVSMESDVGEVVDAAMIFSPADMRRIGERLVRVAQFGR